VYPIQTARDSGLLLIAVCVLVLFCWQVCGSIHEGIWPGCSALPWYPKFCSPGPFVYANLIRKEFVSRG